MNARLFSYVFFTFFVKVTLSDDELNDSDFAIKNEIHLPDVDEDALDLSLKSTKYFSKSKTEMLADIFKKKISRMKSYLETELIILVDGSSSIGDINFRSEMRYIQKMISDVNVGPKAVRLAVIIYSSVAVTYVNHLTSEPEEYEKCSLLHYQLPSIKYKGGATNTKDALLEAKKILSHARPSAQKVIFLVTDGFSNRGDPIPVAESLKQDDVVIYTFGIENGNVEELHKTASRPIREHSYLFESFGEFEGFERRALHQDLKPGIHVEVKNASLCDLLCEDQKEGGCCADEAKCSCGKFSGHFACLCPPGYYGNGMRSQGCKPCPNGTYSDGTAPGDSFVCFPCPDKNHITTKLAASSINDCVCVDGYIKDGKKCKVITCPEISPPSNGYFVKKNCSNILNAACGVRCHLGFILSGSSVRICQKNGTWSGTAPSCKPKRCERLKPVSNADVICVNDEDNFEVVIRYNSTGDRVKHFIKWLDSSMANETLRNPKLQELDIISNKTVELNYTVGTECKYTCARGYFLIGSKTRSCLPMLRWSGLKNTCKAIKCHSLQSIANGTVMPLNCTEKGLKHRFSDVCYYSCNAGYELKGPNSTNCTGRHGTWSGKNYPSKCNDVEAPQLICPKNVTVPTDEGVHFATVKLSLPNATDNSGKEPVVWSKPPFEQDYPLRFIIGDSEVQIYSVDDSGNYAFCTFNVTVEDKESPVILECESPPVFFTNEFLPNSTEIKWKEPVIDDNSGVPIPLKRVPESSDFPLGTTTITYTATDYSGNNASCKINITILENPCSERPEITNTLWNCSSESDLLTCNVSCSEGYTFLSTINSSTLALNCTYSGRKAAWSPDVFHGDIDLFPECSQVETPTEVEGEIIIDGSNELCENLDQLSNEISNEIAKGGGGENIPIFAVCEDDSAEAELENEEEKLEEDTNVIRKKRDAEKKGRRRKKLRIGFSAKGKLTGNATDGELFKDLAKTQEILKNFQAKHGEAKGRSQPKLVIKTNVRLKCKDGSLLKGNICVKCPKGTFHNKESATCDPCPIGQYQEVEGQTQCAPCLAGFSTRKIRRKHRKQCKKICPPGTFGRKKSKAGIALVPCIPCPLGHYQSLSGQSLCEKCPDDFTTPKKGAKEANECVRKEELENLCLRVNCRNGGTCTVSEGFVVCKCPTGFLGAFCEKRFNPCGSSPCYNSAECVIVNTVEYECKCPAGFEGVHCEKEIDECLSNPCGGHGECIDLFGAYRCNCFEGFKGENCSERISMCEELQPCFNSGTCADLGTSYTCFCPEGYTGLHCDEPIDCPSGRCTDKEPVTETTPCTDVPCGDNKKCVVQWNRQPHCVCRDGFRGEACTDAINPHTVLHFPKYGVTEYLLTELPSTDLSEISICVWIQTMDNFNYGTIFSYSTAQDDNTFTLTDYSGLVLYVSGGHVVTDMTANDGFWHFICVTWKSNNGEWKIYLDGRGHTSGSGLANNSVIPGGGKLVVGQEQDLFGGGFNELESFSGRLIYFDVWSRALQPSEVKSLFENCNDVSGDLITWTQMLQNINGNIQEEDSTFCKTCSENLTLFRGQISYEFFDHRMNAKYECEEGYQLKFDNIPELNSKNLKFWHRKCMKYGNWEWDKPICSRVSCGFPGYFLNGKISNGTYLYGDVIHYECDDGYTLLGSNMRICQANGSWSGKAPHCQGDSNNCRKLVAPRHGSMFVYFNRAAPYGQALPAEGDRIEFTCDRGYNLQGFGLLTCLEGGVWDREPPYCQEIKCQYPKEVSHFLPKNIPNTAAFYYGDTLPIICPSKAKRTIICGDFGSWNISTNVCGTQCLEKPEGPENGYVILDERKGETFYEGQTFTVKCKPGFILLGDTRVKCSESGTWSQLRPSICEAVNCGPPPPPPHPYLIAKEEGYRFGQKVHLACAPGYLTTGDILLKCGDDGKWSRIENTCVKI